MEKNTQEVEYIYNLISELSHDKPDTKTLKTLCEHVGLTYESDLVRLMSKVLVRASCVSVQTTKMKKSAKHVIGEA